MRARPLNASRDKNFRMINAFSSKGVRFLSATVATAILRQERGSNVKVRISSTLRVKVRAITAVNSNTPTTNFIGNKRFSMLRITSATSTAGRARVVRRSTISKEMSS